MIQVSEDSDNFISMSETGKTKVISHFDAVEIPKRTNVEFEDALEETGFGKYNIFLILVCGFVLYAAISEACGIGYIIPVSECDLNLNSYTKGILTSTNVIGTMSSCVIWGYISDFKGRKNLLVVNLMLAFITGCVAAFTPSFWGFCILRFINGVCISCPAAITFVYLGEFLSSSTRAKSMAWSTSFVGLVMIALPALAWPLLQNPFKLEFLGLQLNNWRTYMLVNSIPSILVALALINLPESPKYLYHSGRPKEALNIMKRMYSYNTGNSEDSFPILSLDEKIVLQSSENDKNLLEELARQIFPLFKPPILKYTSISCFMQAVVFAVSSGLYFWYPDIIKQISDAGEPGVTVCDVLSSNQNSEDIKSHVECNNTVDDSVFILNIIIGVAYVVAFATWGIAVKFLGARKFFMLCMGLSAISIAAVCILSQRLLIDIVFISTFTLSGTCVYVINAWVVNIFPTQICGLALCLVQTMGRLGSIVSSSTFGIMVEWNCPTTFILYSLNLLVCVGFSLFLPQKK